VKNGITPEAKITHVSPDALYGIAIWKVNAEVPRTLLNFRTLFQVATTIA
jgi:hypothetical protein